MQPLISVIIPVYNGEKYIKAAIDSVRDQTYSNWELLVVDDASTDSTREIVRELTIIDKRILLIESTENFGGPARPRNIGIRNAKGEFLAFLDDDDIWAAHKLEKQIDFMIKNALDFTYTGAKRLGGTAKKVKPVKSFYELMLKSPITTSSVIIRPRGIVRFEEDKQLAAAEDHYLWMNLLYDKYKIGLLPEPLTTYRYREDSISHASAYKSILLYNYSVIKFVFARKIETYKIILVLLKSLVRLLLVFPFRFWK